MFLGPSVVVANTLIALTPKGIFVKPKTPVVASLVAVVDVSAPAEG